MTLDAFCRERPPYGLGMAPEEIEELIESKPLAQQLAADPEVKALADGPGNPTGKNRNGDNVTILKGNSASYLVRRLKRDFPEIAKALARGEYKSARAAQPAVAPLPA